MAADTIVTGSKLTAIANAIRAKTGGSSQMTLDEMPAAIASISGGGSDDRIYNASIYCKQSRMSSDPDADMYSFWAYDLNLASDVAGFETAVAEGGTFGTNASSNVIRPAAFAFSTGLRHIRLPSGIYVGGAAFAGSRVEGIEFAGAWSYAGGQNMPDGTSIGGSPFASCKRLEAIDLSGMANTSQFSNLSYLLANCEKLQSVTLPNAATMPSYAFSGCTSLARVEVPASFTALSNYSVFSGCSALAEVDILGSPSMVGGNYSSLFGSGFTSSNTTFQRLIIRGQTMATFSQSSSSNGYNFLFGGQYVSGGTYAPNIPANLRIYVPDALVATYKADAGWGVYASIIESIDDLPAA